MMYKIILFLLISCSVLFAQNNVLIVEDFNSIDNNTIGGWTSIFQNEDSACRIVYVDDVERKYGYHGQIKMYKGGAGFSGFWIQTVDFKTDESNWQMINLRDLGYNYIEFSIKVLTPGCDFLIKAADKNLVKKEESVGINKLSKYIKPVVGKWQKVLIPITDIQGINKTEFCELVFESIISGEISFLIDDIVMKKNKDDKIEFDEKQVVKKVKKKLDNAMWVWHERDFLTASGRKALLKFCKKNNINILFCQIKMKWKSKNRAAHIIGKNNWKNFIRKAHKNNIEVHMLDGYKEFAKVNNHRKMLAQVLSIVIYNRSVPENERFDGIHHDNEVYLVKEWKQGLEAQKNLLVQSLLLIKKIKVLLKKTKSKLVYGVDIPFWYDEAKTEDGSIGYNIHFDNKDDSVVNHFIRLCDNVGIMDYRNFAAGPDGIITHGKNEIMQATKMKKESVFIGLETTPIEPVKITFNGMTKAEMKREMKLAADVFSKELGFRGFAIHHYRTYRKMEE